MGPGAAQSFCLDSFPPESDPGPEGQVWGTSPAPAPAPIRQSQRAVQLQKEMSPPGGCIWALPLSLSEPELEVVVAIAIRAHRAQSGGFDYK